MKVKSGSPDDATVASTSRSKSVAVSSRFAGPPGIGHGGFVAGLFVDGSAGAVQVTIRQPTPLEVSMRLERSGTFASLRYGTDLIAEAEPAVLRMDVPNPPTLEAARSSAVDSPSFYRGRGVHPTCFGCGMSRPDSDGLRIAAGPVTADRTRQVAAAWTPRKLLSDGRGAVRPRFVAAALDCPGAFAFISDGQSAGLLGRIVVEQYSAVRTDVPHVVTGWQIESDGRKMFAGTAVFTGDGELCAAARATWFPIRR